MNKLLQLALLSIFLIISQTESIAQSSFKFINGIELQSDLLEFSSSSPGHVALSTLVKKVPNRLSTGLTLATEACKSLQFKYAQMMDMEIEGISNFMMFGLIDEWLHTRYRFGGNTKKGIDCSALTGLLLGAVYGFSLPRTAYQQFKASKRIAMENLREGDLVFFNTRGGVSHVGVYLANDRFVHSSSSEGVTISDLKDSYYARKYIGAGRMTQTSEIF